MLFLHHSISTGAIGRDRIVVSTSRCGRDNPGSNPGHGSVRCGVAIMASSRQFFLRSILTYDTDELNDADVVVTSERERARNAEQSRAQLHRKRVVFRPRSRYGRIASTHLRVEWFHTKSKQQRMY